MTDIPRDRRPQKPEYKPIDKPTPTPVELLDELCAAIESPLTCSAPYEQFKSLRQAITELEKERDNWKKQYETLDITSGHNYDLHMADKAKLKTLADHYPDVVEALGELVGHIPAWMNTPYDTRGDLIRETLTKAQSLLSPDSGQEKKNEDRH